MTDIYLHFDACITDYMETHTYYSPGKYKAMQWVTSPNLGPQIGNAAAQPESQSMY